MSKMSGGTPSIASVLLLPKRDATSGGGLELPEVSGRTIPARQARLLGSCARQAGGEALRCTLVLATADKAEGVAVGHRALLGSGGAPGGHLRAQRFGPREDDDGSCHLVGQAITPTTHSREQNVGGCACGERLAPGPVPTPALPEG